MRLKIKRLTFLLTPALLAAGLFPAAALAGTGVIYISPASTTVESGHTLSVSLRISPGTAVNTVQATLNYSASKLQWLSNSIGSAFSTCTVNSGGGGSASFACARLGSSTSSDSLIATVSFKALAGSGSTSLSISGAEAANNGTYTNPSTSGGSVNFYSPSPTPPSSSGTSSTSPSTYPSPTSSATTTTNSAPPAAPAPKVNITVSAGTIQYDTASFPVVTNVPTQVYLEYGTDKHKLNLTTPADSLSKTHITGFVKIKLTPATTYYYRVVAKDVLGNLTRGSTNSFTTRGLTVSVAVLDSRNQPLANQKVTLHSTPATTTTNNQGIATFTNTMPGVHHLEYIDSSGKTYSEIVYVDNDVVAGSKTETAAVQHAAVVLTGFSLPAANNSNGLSLSMFAAALLALIGAGIVGLLARKARTAAQHHLASAPLVWAHEHPAEQEPTIAELADNPKLKPSKAAKKPAKKSS